ncbi:T9SS type A sorting domain-containing protein [Winogradskyella sp. SM1960]|uniref:T9SS type A sorting domain-containing protein n=1 Tax=Winogradskyella sp. SM1960 TaxID=2865955 RepID=UPI001CD7FA5E|nr:T9SS type A sorting domain-containing protein [Winogradskyella sp. SM1960]
MKKITFFHEHIIYKCPVSKTKLLILLLAVFTMSVNAQTFDWETGTLLSFGSSNQNIIAKQIVDGYEVNFSASSSGTPILLGTFNQGTTGKAVMNQQPQQVVRLAFFPAVDIQSLKAFSANASTVNWTFTPVNSPGNVVVTANVAQNAVTVNLNWTNVSIIDITATNGSSHSFGVDDIVFTPYAPPCIVNIPDANFKAALVANTAINTNGDTEIQCSEAIAYTGTISLYNHSISDLTGIESFVNLTNLACQNNLLTSVDLSQNTALTVLNLADNLLTSLDLSQNTALTGFTCANNSITNLDLSSNIALNTITVHSNALVYLNVANGNNSSIPAGFDFYALNNPDLTCIQVDDVSYSTANWTNIDPQTSFSTNCPPCTVSIPDANFKAALVANTAINTDNDTEISCVEATAFTGTISVSGQGISDLTGLESFVNLTELIANDNQLTTIDVSNNIVLETLYVSLNNLTSIDVSSNTALEQLSLFSNSLTSIDISDNALLTFLGVAQNNLTSLNTANGNNSNFTYFEATGNSNLTCIQIDAGFTPPAAWQKDAATSYSDDCAALSVNDFNLNSVSISPNPANSMLNIEMNQAYKQATIFTVLGKEVLKTQDKTINVSGLSKGLFLIKIENESGNVLIRRFIKE